MRFKGLDLNLLIAFEIFLEERSVRKAAVRLNLSQPATSAALARLREYFNDPILVQHGQKMFSTPYAESLLPHVQALISTARTITSISSEFDPSTSSRVFRLVASDYLIAAFFADVTRDLSKKSPAIGFELSLPGVSATKKLELGELDLVITPPNALSGNFLSETLYKESHVLVGCKDNPIFQRSITNKTFLACHFVTVTMGENRSPCFAEQTLSVMGLPHKVTFTAPSFAVLPWLLLGTPRVNIMPKRMADRMCKEFALAQAPLPFAFPLMEETLLYHHSRANDDGLKWLIKQLKIAVTTEPNNP